MARLTYAALALALGALISGFFVRSTAVPLFASIGLSALVLILILRGWARRMRQAPELGRDVVELDEIVDLDAEELDADEFVVVEPGEESGELPVLTGARARRGRPAEAERAPRPRTARPPRPKAGAARGSRRVVVLPGRSRYHMPDCRFAQGKGAEEIAESTARRRHFQPCSACMRD
ncbi:MAG TPA: hypothetical protein VFA34_09575 [Actinomycetota bacterium]|nr:hypothetical protein [Actinomycetota bacterium]